MWAWRLGCPAFCEGEEAIRELKQSRLVFEPGS